ncbi:MAG: DUF5723 family protein [candidate division KSB1 bacterium]|nr:DUF5723 family protein [candidate division KSB1 bacterium]MDZ7346017.1 DUF5723 family protein [candidate division KSB1 bacterium]
MKRGFFLAFCMFAAAGASDIFTNARQYAMSGAYSAAATGCDAIFLNPANLGLPFRNPFSMNFFGISGDFTNNAWSHVIYQRYVGTYLDEREVETILNAVPREGFELSSNLRLHGLSLGYGPFAFGVRGFSSYSGSFARELFELMLHGNELNRLYEFNPVQGDGMSAIAMGLGFGKGYAVENSVIETLSWGVTARYLYGLSYARITRSHFISQTTFAGISGAGTLDLDYAEGGRGYALTAALSLQLQNKWIASVILHNPLSQMEWDIRAVKSTFDFRLKEQPLEALLRSASIDSFFITDYYQEPVEKHLVRLPRVLNIAMAAPFADNYLVSAEFEVGFRDSALSSRDPRLAIGGEIRLTDYLFVRAGASRGGLGPDFFSGGFGISLRRFSFDAAFRTYSGLTSATSTGLGLAAGLSLRI